MSKEITNGEMLPMVGGPLDGEKRMVNFICPFLNGGLAPAGIVFDGYSYLLNKEKKCWEYKCGDTTAVNLK